VCPEEATVCEGELSQAPTTDLPALADRGL
jgi:hypothetical protein